MTGEPTSELSSPPINLINDITVMECPWPRGQSQKSCAKENDHSTRTMVYFYLGIKVRNHISYAHQVNLQV